jgi:hypothetical protein
MISKISEKSELADVIKAHNELVQELNFLSTKLTTKNFDGQIIENLTLTNGEEKDVSHTLGVVPKFRIILRQEGNGVITDIPSGWIKSSIKIKNNGPDSVTLTLFLVRE